jgi:hypothetical protein
MCDLLVAVSCLDFANNLVPFNWSLHQRFFDTRWGERDSDSLALSSDPAPTLSRERDLVPFFMYGLCDFPALAECSCSSLLHNGAGVKHALSLLAVRDALRHPWRVTDPAHAAVFLIPAQAGMLTRGMCGGQASTRERLRKVLKRSEWFRRRSGADHVLVADDFAVQSALLDRWLTPAVAVGHFERGRMPRARAFSVGNSDVYSVFSESSVFGASATPTILFRDVPLSNRTLFLFWAGRTDVGTRHAHYGARQAMVRALAKLGDERRAAFAQLGGAWITSARDGDDAALPLCDNASTVVVGCRTIVPRLDAQRLRERARFCLLLRGDTPTSDALTNNMAAGCVTVAIDDGELMAELPFGARVPWSSVLLTIDEAVFVGDPVGALLGLQAVSAHRLALLSHMTRMHRADLMVHHPRSRWLENVLIEACQR